MPDLTYQNKAYERQGGDVWVIADGGVLLGEANGGFVRSMRRRCTIAEINAGVTLLPALPGFKYRMVGCKAIAVGADAAAVTTVDVLATQGASGVKLAAFAVAGLTRSAVLSAGGTNAAVLADGASYVQNDVNTAVTVGKTGSAITTSTAVDIIFDYVVEE